MTFFIYDKESELKVEKELSPLDRTKETNWTIKFRVFLTNYNIIRCI